MFPSSPPPNSLQTRLASADIFIDFFLILNDKKTAKSIKLLKYNFFKEKRAKFCLFFLFVYPPLAVKNDEGRTSGITFYTQKRFSGERHGANPLKECLRIDSGTRFQCCILSCSQYVGSHRERFLAFAQSLVTDLSACCRFRQNLGSRELGCMIRPVSRITRLVGVRSECVSEVFV